MSLFGELERRTPSRPSPRQGQSNGGGGGGVLRFITAGSVDDGKSTLIGRLLHDAQQILEDQLAAVAHASKKRGFAEVDLSLLTDGLEAERDQGITIDVAYRYFATADRKFIIADTPGHEEYTRNMVTGASTADAAVILADARKGLLPQGKRHLYIAHQLGIRNVVVAVNKMDLVGFDRAVFDSVKAAFERFAGPMRISNLQFIPISALRGDMVVERGDALAWHQGPTLLELLESFEPVEEAVALPFRFPVQLVQRANGGRGYLGRVASGAVFSGDEVVVLPSRRTTTVTGIRTLEGEREAAIAGDSVALSIAGEFDIARGHLIAQALRPPRAVKTLVATLVWLSDEPLNLRRRYVLKHTTRTIKAEVASVNHVVDIHALEPRLDARNVAMNDIAKVTLALHQPVFCDPYAADRGTGAFILVDELSNHTVAAGMVE